MILLAASSSTSGNGLVGFLPIILIGIVGYVVLSRNAKKRRDAAAAVAADLEVGTQVMTTAGLFARVRAVEEDGEILLLEVAPGVVCRYAKAAVSRVIVPEEPASPAHDEEPEPGVDLGKPRDERGDAAA